LSRLRKRRPCRLRKLQGVALAFSIFERERCTRLPVASRGNYLQKPSFASRARSLRPVRKTGLLANSCRGARDGSRVRAAFPCAKSPPLKHLRSGRQLKPHLAYSFPQRIRAPFGFAKVAFREVARTSRDTSRKGHFCEKLPLLCPHPRRRRTGGFVAHRAHGLKPVGQREVVFCLPERLAATELHRRQKNTPCVTAGGGW
jgi:hypothetical protein